MLLRPAEWLLAIRKTTGKNTAEEIVGRRERPVLRPLCSRHYVKEPPLATRRKVFRRQREWCVNGRCFEISALQKVHEISKGCSHPRQALYGYKLIQHFLLALASDVCNPHIGFVSAWRPHPVVSPKITDGVLSPCEVLVPSKKRHPGKLDSLREQGTLNSRANAVKSELFQDNDFFDPRDLLQVKYEMPSQATRQVVPPSATDLMEYE